VSAKKLAAERAAAAAEHEQFGYFRTSLCAVWAQLAADDLCEARWGLSVMARRGRIADIKPDKLAIGTQARIPISHAGDRHVDHTNREPL
jgi:hypothetical protein